MGQADAVNFSQPDRGPSIGGLLLTPGAGADRHQRTLVAVEQAVAPLPCERVDFPYRLRGSRMPDKPEVAIAAPGGNCVNIEAGSPCLYPILTSSNSGTRGPVAGGSIWTDSFEISVGTSFATPIVASVVAQMLEANPRLTPQRVKRILMDTAIRLENVAVERQGWGSIIPGRAVTRALELR